MKIARFVAGLGVLLVAASVALAGKKGIDWDKNADFSKYKTYSYGPPTLTGNPLADKRIEDAIDKNLQAKGWTRAAEGATGDAVVSWHATIQTEQSINTMYSGPYWGTGWGYYGVGVGMTTATTTVSTWRQGTLLVDIFDAAGKNLIFRGWVEETLSDKPEKNAKKIDSAAAKLFYRFPPPPPKPEKK